MKSKFYFKRGKAASWTEQNILLGPGEPGFELDTGKLKVGNGVDKWNDLPYINADPVEVENGAYFIAATGSLPTDAKDGTFCLLDGVLYVRASGDWKKLENSAGAIEVIKISGEDADGAIKIGDQVYETFDDALQAAEDGATLKISGQLENFTISAGKNITVDLNGANIVNDKANPVKITHNASLNIEGEGAIECNKHGASVLDNDGVLNISNGTFSRTVDEKGNGYYVLQNHGDMTIYGGVFSSPGGLSSLIENGYYNYTDTNPNRGHIEGQNAANPKIVINDGTFIDGYTTLKNDDGGIAEINGGNFYGMIWHVGKVLRVKDGYFCTEDGYPCLMCKKLNDNLNAGECYVSGGVWETNADVAISAVSGNPHIEVSGGKFNKKVPASFIATGYTQKLSDDGYYYIIKEG